MKGWIQRLGRLSVPRSRRATLWASFVAEVEGVDVVAVEDVDVVADGGRARDDE